MTSRNMTISTVGVSDWACWPYAHVITNRRPIPTRHRSHVPYKSHAYRNGDPLPGVQLAPPNPVVPCGGAANPIAFLTGVDGPGVAPSAGKGGVILPRRLKVDVPARAVYVLQHRLQNARVLELQVLPVQLEGGARVFDGVVRLHLDVLLEEVPRQEGEGELAEAGLEEEEVDGVDYLRPWDVDVDDSEVLLQSMAQEPAAQVQQDPELLVCHLERQQAVLGDSRIEVLLPDARVRCQVVDDGFPDGNVVVDEWRAFILALSAHDRCPGECIDNRSNRLPLAVRVHLDFRLPHRNEFRVQRYDGLWSRVFRFGVQNLNGRVQMVLPLIVDLVVRVLDLKGHDRRHLPGGIERERLFGAYGAHQEIVEQMPLALPGRFMLRMCNCRVRQREPSAQRGCEHAVDHGHKMRLLRLAILDVDGHADERVYCDAVHPSLQVQLQVLSFVAIELTLVDNDADLFGEPARSRPEHSMVRARNRRVEHQDGRNTVDGFPRGYRLIPLASATPAFRRRLSLNAALKNLREGDTRRLAIAAGRLL
ncbi:hypothetical protein TPAR_05359 [Tolypocladium paradoxum]|uniref:Uncharacterized protein n=1 Tax=Tolypocladium paradoxum TaxID=94208 RepID=A0A2S4KW75_9HYPO|nr:hypothetical protein TPAR_05359 [Tolypocladium paradoxum]